MFKSVEDYSLRSDLFLLDDSDIKEERMNQKKLLTLSFDEENGKERLLKYHTALTERTPYQYFGTGFCIAKNYHTLKKYSQSGESDLPGPKLHLLKFYLPDGSYIFIRSVIETRELSILISINGTSDKELDEKSNEVEIKLLDFIATIE